MSAVAFWLLVYGLCLLVVVTFMACAARLNRWSDQASERHLRTRKGGE